MSGVKAPRAPRAAPRNAPRPPPRAPARPAVQDRPGHWQMVWRRQRRMLAPAMLGLVLLGLVGFGLGLAHNFSEGGPLRTELGAITADLGLRVAQIRIEGRQKTPEAQVLEALKIAPGDPMLAFSVAAARSRIEGIQWVQQASVARQLPDTIVVRLQERSPFAVWQHDGRFLLIDHDGNTVTSTESEFKTFAKELPWVVGTGAPQAAAAMLALLAAQPVVQSRVASIVRVGERRWDLYLRNGTDVMLPEGAEEQALARLVELQTAHALLDRPMQMLDLRLPDRFTFRPLPHGDGKDPASPGQRKPT